MPDKPGPIEVSNIQADGVTLTWTPPLKDGGAPITGYIVEKKEDKPDSEWSRLNITPVKEVTYRTPRLTTGIAYFFRVMAINKAGVSPPSETTKSVLCERPAGKFDIQEIEFHIYIKVFYNISFFFQKITSAPVIMNYFFVKKFTHQKMLKIYKNCS